MNKLFIFGCFSIILLGGATYGYYTPQMLETPLRESPYNFTSLNYQLIFVFTNLTSLIFIAFVGIIVDRIKLSHSLIIVAIVNVFTVVAIGLCFQYMFSGYLVVFYVFRGLYGLSGDSLFLVWNIVTVIYAKEFYEPLSGLAYFVVPIFFALNSVITTLAYSQSQSVSLCMYIGAGVAFLSVLFSFIFIQTYMKESEDTELQPKEQLISLRDKEKELLQIQQEEKAQKQPNYGFNSIFWILMALTFLNSMSYISMFQNFDDILVRCYGFTYEQAGFFITAGQVWLFLVAIFMSYFSSKWPQHRRSFMLVVSIYLAISYSLLYFLPFSSEPTTLHYIVLSIYYCLVTVTFNSSLFLFQFMSCVVKESQLGFATSIRTAFLSLAQLIGAALTVYALSGSSAAQLPAGYRNLELIFGIGSILLVVTLIYLMREEFRILDNTMEDGQRIKKLKIDK